MQKIINFIRNLPSFFRREKHCVLIEEEEGSICITEARISETEKTIRITNRVRGESLEEFTQPLFKADYLVLAMYEKNATTVQNTVHLFRNDPEKKMTEEEFEQLISRGLWEYMNGYRGFSAKKMESNETDTVLFDITVAELSIDGHIVVSPVGITGKNLSIRLRGTFLTRKKIEEIRILEQWANAVIPVEANGILSVFLAGEKDTALFCGEKRTSAFHARKDRTLYAGDMQWSLEQILEEIRGELLVDEDTAHDIFETFSTEKMSPAFSNFIERIFSKNIKTFLASIDEAAKKQGRANAPTIHLIFSMPMPPEERWLKNAGRFKINSLEEKFGNAGFKSIDPKERAEEFRTYVLAACPMLFSKNDAANKLLLHRAKWLIDPAHKNI